MKNIHSILEQTLPANYGATTDLKRIGETPFLHGGLNIVYGRESSGKSYQLAQVLKGIDHVIYLDSDGSNGTQFREHCTANGVGYVNIPNLPSRAGTTILDVVNDIIRKVAIKVDAEGGRAVFVIDSLTSTIDGAGINNAESISPILYGLNHLAEQTNSSIILIDHATDIKNAKGTVVDFKMEGNAGAKARTTVTTVKYEPLKSTEPQKGGTFTVVRARGNKDKLVKGTAVIIKNKGTLEDVRDFIEEKLGKGEFTTTDLNRVTNSSKTKWIRESAKILLTARKKGQTTYYKLIEHGVVKQNSSTKQESFVVDEQARVAMYRLQYPWITPAMTDSEVLFKVEEE